jgi:uracil-DNA glycosylase
MSADEGKYKRLRDDVKKCQRCDLYKDATQGVMGEGPLDAKIFLVGEQPGDWEDQLGHPFVGPAGKLLDKILEQAGLSRDTVYVTNAVKHFKFERKGKRRLHAKPNAVQIAACHLWLERELRMVMPKVVICLGTTAAHAIFGKAMVIKHSRGKFLKSHWSDYTYVTIHPSAILRMPKKEERELAIHELVLDFKKVKRALNGK